MGKEKHTDEGEGEKDKGREGVRGRETRLWFGCFPHSSFSINAQSC